MRGIATVNATATAVPGHPVPQSEIRDAFSRMLRLDARRDAALRSIFDNAGIDHRYGVFPVEYLLDRRSLARRSQEYREQAIALGRRVASNCLDRAGIAAADVDFLVTVSCTGVMIPALDAYLIEALGFRRNVRRIPITELGCAAGAAALARAADLVSAEPGSRALVVSVELPSLTIQPADLSQANLVSSALFADGAAAALVAGDPVPGGAVVLGSESYLFPQSTGAMGFDLRDDGFHIVLSKDVPLLIRGGIAAVVGRLLERAGVARESIDAWILHPGGRKVLVNVEEELGLPRASTQPSWDVLRNYGNLSSATVLFVLHEWLARLRPAGRHGLLAAFGPGFSAELVLLRWS